MSPTRTTAILLPIAVIAVALLAWLGFSFLRLRLEAANAEWQTRSFDELRMQAIHTDPARAVSCLQHLLIDYPSGTKQRHGSHLDQTVERHRAAVAREIIAYLRQATGKDFGDDPGAWVQSYGEQE